MSGTGIGAATGTSLAPANAMSVDVEDYFQVQAFASIIDRAEWDTIPRRVERNTDRILASFDTAGVKATFFTLGWVAERHPALIRRIVDGGHELASHGHGHQLVHSLTPAQFREDLVRAKGVLESAGGAAVQGYRAPTFSIGPQNPWAYDVLAETGHRYSSSLYPVKHDLYGAPDAPRFAYRPTAANLLELPMTTVRLGGRNLPISGGGYFRLMPYTVFRTLLRRFHRAEHQPGMFYFHPWEIDPGQPRVAAAPLRSRFRHGVNLRAMLPRLERLLKDFRWDRIDQVYAADLGKLT
jgi:polysaccharide deacetylase family protein (PEP-CTERM system associated)